MTEGGSNLKLVESTVIVMVSSWAWMDWPKFPIKQVETSRIDAKWTQRMTSGRALMLSTDVCSRGALADCWTPLNRFQIPTSPSTFKNRIADSVFVTMATKNADQGGESVGLAGRLSEISQERLVEEVISAWDEVNATERLIASLRQKVSSLEMELSEKESAVIGRVSEVELQEALRVSEARVSQLQRSLENERVRRKSLEDSGGEARLAELREENARLLKSEEELMVMILEMEGRIDRLLVVIKDGVSVDG